MSLIERAIQALKAQLRSKRHDAIDPKYKIVPDDLMTIPMTRRNTTQRTGCIPSTALPRV